MAGKQINTPEDVFGYTDDSGVGGAEYVPFKNTGAVAITQYDTVAFRTTVATEIPEIELYDTSAYGGERFAGIAQEAIAVDATGLVATGGYSLVNCDNNDPDIGVAVIPDAAVDGKVDVDAGALAAATTYFGRFLGVENASNIAAMWIRPFTTGPDT